MRLAPELFLQKRLRGHQLLVDIPLLDVWQIDLKNGGNGRTIGDIRAVVEGASFRDLPLVVRGLFSLREKMGAVLGWDYHPTSIPSNSYFYRLEADDMANSIEPCGTRYPPLTLLYQFEGEVLLETINTTTHAFILFSLEAQTGGYRGYLAVYAKDQTWWSRYYMALIEPFRLWFVYPALVRTLKRLWQHHYGNSE